MHAVRPIGSTIRNLRFQLKKLKPQSIMSRFSNAPWPSRHLEIYHLATLLRRRHCHRVHTTPRCLHCISLFSRVPWKEGPPQVFTEFSPSELSREGPPGILLTKSGPQLGYHSLFSCVPWREGPSRVFTKFSPSELSREGPLGIFLAKSGPQLWYHLLGLWVPP